MNYRLESESSWGAQNCIFTVVFKGAEKDKKKNISGKREFLRKVDF